MKITRDVEKLKDQSFDVLVVGGGITGAWTAYDAALRGLKVALIDKGDWGSGTSMASSKLIHGGLRYLEHYDFKLVRSALKERRLLNHLGPHQIWPLRFLVPLYKGGRVGPLKFKLGLTLYDWLAGKDQPVQGHAKHDPEDLKVLFPNMQSDGLRCAFSYGDCQTDDARCTLEMVYGAQTAQAQACSYVGADEILIKEGRAYGARVTDQISTESFDILAKSVVMATSFWSGLIPGMPDRARQSIRMSKGVHLVMPRLDTDHALLLTALSDGRVFFVIPWYERTLIGTTDTDYEGSPDATMVNEADIDYLLKEAQQNLEGIRWTRDDVIGSFCGLRMLQQKNEENPSAASREWILEQYHENILMPLGGKFTTAREDAAKIVDALYPLLKRPLKKTSTDERPFPWAPEGNFSTWKNAMLEELSAAGVDALASQYLLSRHGKFVKEVLALIRANPDLAQRIESELPFIKAEFEFAKTCEGTQNEDDLFRRRIPLKILGSRPIPNMD